MNRREFLKLVGLMGAGATVLPGCIGAEQGEKDTLVSPVTLADESGTGTSTWYASVCQQCSAGCGIVVRVLEGRAKKIEGNPAHPVNQGKLCARGQAALQLLYNPDRLRGPVKNAGPRGSGKFIETSWDEGMASVAERLSAIRSQNAPDRLLFLAGSLHGHQALVADRFARAFGAPGCTAYELFGNDPYLVANRLVFGREALPDYDLDNASYVLSFGANFLETWLSPVRFGRGFGNLHQGRPGRRGKIVQIEPRLSLTASRADEWIPINPGTEGLLALGIANVIVAEDLASGAPPQALQSWRSGLAEFTLERVSLGTGVPEARIQGLAREFASTQPGVAFGGASVAGHTNGVVSLVAINSLNVLTGSVGVAGGVRFVQNPGVPDSQPRIPTAYSGLRAAVDRLNSGNVDTVIVFGTNPVFTSTPSSGLREAFLKANFVVAFSSFLDETSVLADLILPDSTFLERWGDDVPEYGGGYSIYGTAQPVVSTAYDTRSSLDVLLALAQSVDDTTRLGLPWNNTLEVLKEFAGSLQKLDRGSIRNESVEQFWPELLRQGGWWLRDDIAASTVIQPVALPPLVFDEPRFDGQMEVYPFQLHIYESISLSDGRGANLPWLQEMPDPLSTAVWSSWVEINPATARKLGIQDGDAVWVESQSGKILTAAVTFPGAMPDVVSIPVGQGHSSYGRYAQDRGVNPLDLLAPLVDDQSGALAYEATRVSVTKAVGVPKLVPRLVRVEMVQSETPGTTFFE
ncbi:MAG: molybdopterin-dependent oxidoreductase [Chloroflexi bacterium]|nr:molybdopterin-dependent oxidoreductase [Chloroflexota bacterium]